MRLFSAWRWLVVGALLCALTKLVAAATVPVSTSHAGADAAEVGSALFPRFEFSIDLETVPARR